MATQSLAIKYRPTTFDDVVEQSTIKTILQYQLDNNLTKNAYLFCGGAGTGKTTCARIFANAINHYQGNAIEIDAASNSGVDDVREIIKQAKTKSLESEYKIFIIDECHSLSNTAWQALLKLIEEPPVKSVFIFCTTDPQKIPKTILSRVQRFDFQRISTGSIVKRLVYILNKEQNEQNEFTTIEDDAVEYIAKIADGGMRDAITLLDKCLSYDKEITLYNVVNALGVLDFGEMFTLLESIIEKDKNGIIEFIEGVHYSGRDLKMFIKQFTTFVLDVAKYQISNSPDKDVSFQFIQIPQIYKPQLDKFLKINFMHLLQVLIKLSADAKWEENPKALIEATLLLECV